MKTKLLFALIIFASMLLSAAKPYDYLYAGYWWNGAWIPGLITQESRFAPIPQVVEGGALFYGPGIMEATVEYYKLDWTPDIVDGVSLLTCAEIGHKVWLQRPGKDWEGPFLVADCSQRDDLYAHVFYRHEVVEVGFETAKRWGMAKRIDSNPWYKAYLWRIDGVKVSRVPPNMITEKSVTMESWWSGVVQFAQPEDDICKLVYHGPETEWNKSDMPIWRINCVWKQFRPMYEKLSNRR
jgi:hypothetical protein